MLARNAILTALFVLMSGAMAADKPSVEARIRMEAENRGQTTWVAGGYGNAETVSPTVHYTHEAVLDRRVDRDEEHPVTNVGYHHTFATRAEPYMTQPGYAPTKPSVQYRLDRENQR